MTIVLEVASPAEPPKEFRKDLENALYGEWRNAQTLEEQQRIESELRQLVKGHALSVMFVVLRRSDPALADEAVNRVMYDLGNFGGQCLFTTWAHKIISTTMYGQRRNERRRKETLISEIPGFDVPGDRTPSWVDVMCTVESLLSPADQRIFEEVVLLGKTHDEAAASLDLPKSTLTRKWNRIKGVLRNGFTK